MIRSYAESKIIATGATAAEIAMDLDPNKQYLLTAKAAMWFRIVKAGEATNVASAGDHSHYLAAGAAAKVAAIGPRNRVSVIQDAGAGTAILSEYPHVTFVI